MICCKLYFVRRFIIAVLRRNSKRNSRMWKLKNVRSITPNASFLLYIGILNAVPKAKLLYPCERHSQSKRKRNQKSVQKQK